MCPDDAPHTPTLRAADIADRIGGTLHGDGTTLVCGVAPLDEAAPTDLSWIGAAEYLPKLARCKAGVVLVPAGTAPVAGRTIIAVADPDIALCSVLEALALPGAPPPVGIDPAARVAPGAQIAPDACIGPFVYVGPGAEVGAATQLYPGVCVGAHSRIGRGCTLHPNVVVREHCEIGDRVILHANVSIGADGFGYLPRGGRHVKIPQIGRVVIEDDVEIGANTCIDRARSGVTRIGRGTKIDNLVQIGHNVRVGEHCIIVSQVGVSGSTTLGDYVVLAGQVGLTDHVRLGNGVQVAAKSGVSGDIPDGKIYRGIPAVDYHEYGRQTVGIRRLPRLMEQLRELQKRVGQLESAKDHRPRG